ncbi:unnamed protein product [Mytilus coruscus]|uniref:Reverse transcriptase domain-containing protein n=1 Tax=Mytilus coruscus TaxID=42192 RepID=A0A6J8A2V4_MYTCO|nr:unnamed protein product [Mytilus coruscus]
MRSANSKIKELELVIENNTTAISKSETRISKVSVVANETKTCLNSEAALITNISDIRSTGICSLKTAAVQTADKSVSVVPLDSPIRPETPHESTACPILPAHDRILLHVSQETIPKTDNYQVNNMSTLPKKIVESTNIHANDTKSISVHISKINLSSAILSGGNLSTWFKLNRGVRQGSALCAKLYLIFINDLTNELESSNKGAFLYDINSSSPVQADDISLIATSHKSAQEMVSICEQYSESWSFSFSPAKIKLLQFGKKLTGPDIFLYNEPIVPVKSATHVGISLDTSIRSGINPAVLNSIVCAKIIR